MLSIGTRATVPCELCQVRKEAALSDVHGVPRATLVGAFVDIVCTKYQRFVIHWEILFHRLVEIPRNLQVVLSALLELQIFHHCPR